MTPDQKTRIKGYAQGYNSNLTDGATLDLVIDTVVDRVLLYLNNTVLDPRIERIVAQAVVAAYKQNNSEVSLEPTQSVKSVIDNGQHVTFSDSAVGYLGDDTGALGGFTDLLAPYRRLHVNHTPVQGYNQ